MISWQLAVGNWQFESEKFEYLSSRLKGKSPVGGGCDGVGIYWQAPVGGGSDGVGIFWQALLDPGLKRTGKAG